MVDMEVGELLGLTVGTVVNIAIDRKGGRQGGQ